MENGKYRILAIDGGGIRGIVPGQVLSRIESILGEKTGEYFDMIAGTSTGGIIACALLLPGREDPSTPRYAAEEVVKLYMDFGRKIFRLVFRHRLRTLWGLLNEKYPARGLEEVLGSYFGDTKLSGLIKPTLITAYDTSERRTVFFTQHDAVNRPGKDFLVRDITRATSAAPTYFECARVPSGPDTGPFMSLIDGGVFAGSPGMCAYAEARQYWKATAADLEILSLGTGSSKEPYPYGKVRNWGKAGWVRPLLEIMLSASSETVDYQLRQIFSSVNAEGQYLRINASIPPAVSPRMDNAEKGNMDALKRFGDELFLQYESDIRNFFHL